MRSDIIIEKKAVEAKGNKTYEESRKFSLKMTLDLDQKEFKRRQEEYNRK